MDSWNWLDWILLLIIVASTVTAIMKGFVQELLSLATVVAGLVAAAMGYSRAAGWFEDLTRSHEVALGLGFLVIFVGTLVAGAIIQMVVRRLIKSAGIEWFNRLLGGAFGLVRGILVDAILVMAMLSFAIKPDAVQQSALSPYVTTGARVLVYAMPGSLRSQFQQGFEKFRGALIQKDKEANP